MRLKPKTNMQKTKIETIEAHAKRINKKTVTVKACKKYRDKTELLPLFAFRNGEYLETGKSQKFIVEE